MKRWLGAFMAFCMLFTLAQPWVVATASESQPTIEAESVSMTIGGEDASAKISVKNNPGIAGLKIRVSYPEQVLELKSAVQGEIGDKFQNKSFQTVSRVGNWNNLDSTENVAGDGALAVLTFGLKDGAAAGTYDVTITVEEAYDAADKNITFETVKGVITVTKETEYAVTYVASPTEGGTVSGVATAAQGTTVTVTATPNDGYKLVKITAGSEDITESKSFSMPAEAVTVTATFEELPETEYAVTYVASPTEGGTVSGVAKAAQGTTVTVTATPNDGYKLVKITAGSEDITESKSFSMPANAVTVTATFEKEPVTEYDITYVASPTEGGTVSGVAKAAQGTNVTVTATPNDGYKLVKITAGSEDITESKSFSMPANAVTVTATFEKKDPAPACYIATSVYGSYDCPEVWTLRRFRDDVLGSTWYGRLFIRAYYATSPTLVKWFGDADWFQNFWRDRLDDLVQGLQDDGFESTPYEDQDWRS